ncbi:MAG: C4-dicarboxylate transporter, partial [Polaromonas sp.]|nr:C4-dicarboxylate transporter [Polaromonas sp.]
YVDRVTRKIMEPVTTMQIYKGAIPFVLIQLTMVGLLIAFPQLVTGSLDQKQEVNMESIGDQMRNSLPAQGEGAEYGSEEAPAAPSLPGAGENAAPAASAASPEAAPAPEDDPMKAMQDALKAEDKK